MSDEQQRLYNERIVPPKPGSDNLFDVSYAKNGESAVTCWYNFPNDYERRKYLLGNLSEKLRNPEFRKIEGFSYRLGRVHTGGDGKAVRRIPGSIH